MTLPVVYHKNYVTPLPDGHRFPMSKFGELATYLKNNHAGSLQFYDCDPVSEETLLGAHDADYVENFRHGTLSEDHCRRIGLPWSEGLVRRTMTAVGGTVRTAQLALETGLACNTAGGTHHAGPARGAGFCILNDLAVAAHWALRREDVDTVLVVDLDVHQGNGTAEGTRDCSDIRTFSMHCEANYPFEPVESDRDVPLADGIGDDRYMEVLSDRLGAVLEHCDPDLAIYDAGVDVHEKDRLGRLNLSSDGVIRRDQFVMKSLNSRGISVAAVIGGGYDRDIEALARRHALLHESAIQILKRDVDSENHPVSTS
jgi:acetoin utilization deacetylase AcuC-like enzyme